MASLQGRSGAVSVIAVAERGALYDPGPCMCDSPLLFYLQKRELDVEEGFLQYTHLTCRHTCTLIAGYMFDASESQEFWRF